LTTTQECPERLDSRVVGDHAGAGRLAVHVGEKVEVAKLPGSDQRLHRRRLRIVGAHLVLHSDPALELLHPGHDLHLDRHNVILARRLS
jgi:hypothetical protein